MINIPAYLRTLCLCMLGICAATEITFAQTSDAPRAEATATTANIMPITRTLTSADGRTIDVTILSKSATAIKAARADGKEFEIPLNNLSGVDRAFVTALIEPAHRQLTAFLYYDDRYLTDKGKPSIGKMLENAGFKVTCGGWGKPVDRDGIKISENTILLEKLSDLELRKFDVVWINGELGWYDEIPQRRINEANTRQGIRLLKLLADGKLMVWRSEIKPYKPSFITGNGEVYNKKNNLAKEASKPYFTIEANTFFYNDSVTEYRKEDNSYFRSSTHPEILDQIMDNLKKRIPQLSK